MSREHWYLRRLAQLLLRGSEAELILADLEEARQRDLDRGMSSRRARRRYVLNALASAISLQRARVRSTFDAGAAALGDRHRRRWGLAGTWLDVKLGLRMLAKQPGMTCVAVFALSVGIPVGLAPMHFVRAVQSPLPFDEGERIHVLRNLNVATARDEQPSLYDFAQWREQLASFESVGAATIRTAYNVISENGRAAPVWGAAVSTAKQKMPPNAVAAARNKAWRKVFMIFLRSSIHGGVDASRHPRRQLVG